MRPPTLVLDRDPRVPDVCVPSVSLRQCPFGLAAGDEVAVVDPVSNFHGMATVVDIDRKLVPFGPHAWDMRIWLDVKGTDV